MARFKRIIVSNPAKSQEEKRWLKPERFRFIFLIHCEVDIDSIGWIQVLLFFSTTCLAYGVNCFRKSHIMRITLTRSYENC